MAIKINGSNIAQMRINGYDIKLAKINGSIVFEKVKLVKTFYGDSKQNTTTGKNKFDYSKTPYSESESILNGATVLYNENTGILSIDNINKSGSATIKSAWKSNTNAQILPAGTYYIPFQFNITKVSGGGGQTSIGVNTFDSDVYLNQWFIVVDSGNIKNVVMQINEGDTQDTIFEPYTGGIPSPNPDYPQQIKSIIGANLKVSNGTNELLIPINLQGNILAKVGDYADELQVYSNGDVNIVKKVNTILSYNNETISNDYLSTTGELTVGATIYYISNDPTTITVDNIKSELDEFGDYSSMDIEVTYG